MAFLIRNVPLLFVKFVQLVREGGYVPQSLEKVYGMKVTDLQVRWVQWSLMQK